MSRFNGWLRKLFFEHYWAVLIGTYILVLTVLLACYLLIRAIG